MIEGRHQQLRREFFLMKRSTRRLKRLALTLLFADVLGFLVLRILTDYQQFIF